MLERGKGRAAEKPRFWPDVRLPELAKHFSMLLRPGVRARQLVITWPLASSYLHFTNEARSLAVQAIINEGTSRESAIRKSAVRQVFDAAGLSPILDAPAPGASFIRVLEYQLPNSAPEIDQLILDVLRRGFGLAEGVSLHVSLWRG